VWAARRADGGRAMRYVCLVYLVEKDMLATDGPLAELRD
jgi:hypothetical protein